MKYKYYFSDKDNSNVLQLPIPLESLPPINTSSNNETFETFNNGSFNLISNVNLIETSFDFKLPGKGKNYSFQTVKNVNPDSYITLFNECMAYKKPIKFTISRNDGTYYFNDLFSIENFEWHESRNCDYIVSISLRQWREY